jgi:hypothetical protein
MVGPMEGIVETNVAAAGRTIHSANDNPMPRNLDGSDASSESHNKAEVRKNSNNNVSELVAKSKKAASSLWTLLHAKVRRISVENVGRNACSWKNQAPSRITGMKNECSPDLFSA